MPGMAAGAAQAERALGLATFATSLRGGTRDSGSAAFSPVARGNPRRCSPGLGVYVGEPGLKDLRLTKPASDTFVLADTDGNTTLFTSQPARRAVAADVGGPARYRQAERHKHDDVRDGPGTTPAIVRPRRVLGPVPAGVTCPAEYVSPLARGCRALDLDYAAAGTPAPAGAGAGDGRVRQIRYTAWDPVTSAIRSVPVAAYKYDATGRLHEVRDPRLPLLAPTVYGYDGLGHVTSVRDGTDEPWQLGYGILGSDTNAGRLVTIKRSALSAGVAVTAVTAVNYSVPISGPGAPYDLSVGQTSRWGQSSAPVGATAIVPPHTGTSFSTALVAPPEVFMDGQLLSLQALRDGQDCTRG